MTHENEFIRAENIDDDIAGAPPGAAEGDGLIVSYDYRQKRKAPLPSRVRERIEELEASRRHRGFRRIVAGLPIGP